MGHFRIVTITGTERAYGIGDSVRIFSDGSGALIALALQVVDALLQLPPAPLPWRGWISASCSSCGNFSKSMFVFQLSEEVPDGRVSPANCIVPALVESCNNISVYVEHFKESCKPLKYT